MPIGIRGIQTRDLGVFTVANLPTTTTLKTLAPGDLAYASNGRKGAEGAGAGTGCPVFYDGAWKSSLTGTAVTA